MSLEDTNHHHHHPLDPGVEQVDDIMDSLSMLPLNADQLDTLAKLNSMSESQMTHLLARLQQQHQPYPEVYNEESERHPTATAEEAGQGSSGEEVFPVRALPSRAVKDDKNGGDSATSNKHPLRDSAYQSKEQSTEQYNNSSRPGSTTVSPTQTNDNHAPVNNQPRDNSEVHDLHPTIQEVFM